MYRTRVLIKSAWMRISDAQYIQRARSGLYKLWLNKRGCYSCMHDDAVSLVPVSGALVVHLRAKMFLHEMEQNIFSLQVDYLLFIYSALLAQACYPVLWVHLVILQMVAPFLVAHLVTVLNCWPSNNGRLSLTYCYGKSNIWIENLYRFWAMCFHNAIFFFLTIRGMNTTKCNFITVFLRSSAGKTFLENKISMLFSYSYFHVMPEQLFLAPELNWKWTVFTDLRGKRFWFDTLVWNK